MALKKIRLAWSTPIIKGGRWRLGLFNLQELPTPFAGAESTKRPEYWKKYIHHELHLSGRGLLLWGSGAALAAYLAGAAVLLLKLESSNPHSEVKYTDLILPHRWAELDRLRAAGWARQSQAALERGEFWRGLSLARLALAKNPTDWENRERVGQMLIAMRLVWQARQLLEDGLELGYPPKSYLQLGFELARDADRPGEWEALVGKAKARYAELKPEQRRSGEDRWLNEQLAQSLIAAGRLDEALVSLAELHGRDNSLWRKTEVTRLLEAKKPIEALAVARTWAAAEEKHPEPLRLVARAAREAQDLPALRETLATLRRRWPTKAEVWLFGIVQLRLAGLDADATRWCEETILRLGASPDLPGPLALVLAEMGMESELVKFENQLVERGQSLAPIWSARLRAAAAKQNWSAVTAWADRLLRDESQRRAPEADRRFTVLARQLALACLESAPATQSSLVEETGRRPLTLKMYYLIIDALLAADRAGTAARVLTQAEGPYQDASGLAVRRSRVTKELEQREPESIKGHLEPTLADYDAFRQSLDEIAINEGDTGALALIQTVRRASPDWLSARSAELELLELPLQARAGDVLKVQLLVRRRLARSEAAAAELLALARALRNEKKEEVATLIVREILRARPGDTDALHQLEAWHPKDENSVLEARAEPDRRGE